MEKYDWLGICLEMMAKYYPVDIRTKSDSEKYWEISEHLFRLMEHSELINRRNKDEEQNRRNEIIRDFMKIFATISRDSMKNSDSDNDANYDSNSAINNLLLLSLMD
jgi:hypothetical protein